MSLAVKIRRGQGPVFGPLRRLIKSVLHIHVPVAGPLKPMFSLFYRLHVGVAEGLIWAARFFWYEPLFRSQCRSIGERFRMEKLPYIGGRGAMTIGSGVRLSGRQSIAFSNWGEWGEPELRIGNETFVGHDCSFSVARSVCIGDHCLLATGVRVQDHDGHPIDAAERRVGRSSATVQPVVIESDVWIGTGAIILKGVHIGDRAVVAARSVVTKDVPPDTIVAGNPARVVKQLVSVAANIETGESEPKLCV